MLMGMEHATSVHDPFFFVDAKCPTLRVEGAFGEWPEATGATNNTTL